MRFQDLFVPRWQHSNPDVRKNAVGKMKDIKLLTQISEMDEHQMVRDAAMTRLEELTGQQQVNVTE